MKSVLVANRGEIALRVMRTCREMGIATVAVYSEADRDALHVRYADKAVCIGPPASAQSYLVQEKIIEAALRTGAEGIHPGYGFLSENAGFARRVKEAGLTFIGPPIEAIRVMGDKTEARLRMAEVGVPLTPGTKDALSGIDEAREVAASIGYPVLLKAAAGGGGKGMRVVEREQDLASALETAMREAQSAFGDGRVFVEKYITQPRHIEVQILGDQHGNLVHLFERECTIQRRHQKVIEEAPSPALTPELRAQMGEAAIRAAAAVGYYSTGTVEFLYDVTGEFYFMEMNTRLQVEHPVTEWITGLDLVREQIQVARGKALTFRQEDLHIHGHSMECRVYAEDSRRNFMPDPGPLVRYREPGGPGVRVDSGVEQGGIIPVHYDPMISKLSTWGRTRIEAIDRMKRALDEYEIAGVETTMPFCAFVMQHEGFRAGEMSTRFVEREFKPEYLPAPSSEQQEMAALAAVLLHTRRGSASPTPVAAGPAEPVSRWSLRRRV